MALKLISIDNAGATKQVATIFADAKSEVPVTGAATAALMTDFNGTLDAGSKLYTADLDVAILKTNDAWNWVGEE